MGATLLPSAKLLIPQGGRHALNMDGGARRDCLSR